MATDAAPDYCPFCGARLRDETDAYGTHLAEHDDCAERAEAWGAAERGPAAPRTATDRTLGVRMALGGVVALAVLVYAVLVAGQLLLGLLGAGVVLLAFYLGGRLVSAGVR